MEALELCPDAVLVEGNLSKYADTAHRIFKICGDYTDRMELYSIDECFLDATETHERFGGAWKVGKAIKRRIREDLGLTCSVGIAPNKVLAKLASGMKKPDGLTEIRRDEVEGLLENLPVEELHGIGSKVGARLMRMGIATAGVLGRTPRHVLRREFGVYGDVLLGMGKGIYYSPVVPYHDEPDIKSVSHSYTLDRNTRNWKIVNHHLLRLSEMVGRRLREESYSGRTITLVLRYADMHTFCRQKSISEYLDDGYDIYQAALSILQKQMSDKRAVRLIGVSVSNLVKGTRQLDMFEDPRTRNLQKAVDAINDRFGEFTIRRASLVELKIRPKSHGFQKSQLSV
jgi:DNA polymerase-4